VTCDVVFNEQVQWDCGTGGDDAEPGIGDNVFTMEYTNMGHAALETEGVDEDPAEQSLLPADDDDAEVDDNVDDDNLNADHDNGAPLHFCSINDILGTVRFALHALVAKELHMVSSNKPDSFTEVEHNPRWGKAMMEEMMSIKENDTWSLVDLPPDRKLIKVKWVFKVK
jgi:hypothetical protein